MYRTRLSERTSLGYGRPSRRLPPGWAGCRARSRWWPSPRPIRRRPSRPPSQRDSGTWGRTGSRSWRRRSASWAGTRPPGIWSGMFRAERPNRLRSWRIFSTPWIGSSWPEDLGFAAGGGEARAGSGPGELHRGGSQERVQPDEALEAIHEILELPGMEVRGLMTMAPFVEDERILRRPFARLRRIHEEAGKLPGYQAGSCPWE